MNCVDSEIVLRGDYQSFSASHFQIQFEKCDNSTRPEGDFCKSDREITDWLQRKFIIVLNNSHRFNEEDYTAKNKVVKESVLSWIPIRSTIREEVIFEISRQ